GPAAFVVARRQPYLELAHVWIAERIVGQDFRRDLERDDPSARPFRSLQCHCAHRSVRPGESTSAARWRMSRSGAAAVPGPATERLEPAEQLRDFMDGLEQRVRMPLGLEQRRPIRVGTFLREPTASLADGYADRRIASGVGPTSPQPPTALEQIIAQ